jgi:hypothetical protein
VWAPPRRRRRGGRRLHQYSSARLYSF